jgi:hypothetical protein
MGQFLRVKSLDGDDAGIQSVAIVGAAAAVQVVSCA